MVLTSVFLCDMPFSETISTHTDSSGQKLAFVGCIVALYSFKVDMPENKCSYPFVVV